VQNYTKLPDIKRVIVNTDAIQQQVCISSSRAIGSILLFYILSSYYEVIFRILLSSLEPFPENRHWSVWNIFYLSILVEIFK
jgi:hypothetical protein